MLDWIALAAGTLGTSGMLAACGTGSQAERQKPVPGSLRDLASGVQQLKLLSAQSELPRGRSRFAFGLLDENNRLIEGVTPRVWLAKDQTSRARGPFPGRWLEMTGYDKTNDRSPRSDVTGYYLAEVDLPDPGKWLALAVVEVATQRAAAHGAVPVRPRVVTQVGTQAPAVQTPVATSQTDRHRICTRTPPCPMHDISFDDALTSGKPTVLGVGTPLLCPSRMCGPVLDEQLLVFQRFGGSKANFIHLEIYPERDQDKPAALWTTWGFRNEPWTLVIDRNGIVRASLGDGPAAASEIGAALQPLLS
ncbi:MAG: hypothetical protein ACRDPT_06765 [Streptomycetales bacterium]